MHCVTLIGWFLLHKTENNNDPNTASINTTVATETSATAVSSAPNMTPTDATKAALDAATSAQNSSTLTELKPVSLTVSPDPQNLTQFGQQQPQQQQQQGQQQQQDQQQQQYSSKCFYVTRDLHQVALLSAVTTTYH